MSKSKDVSYNLSWSSLCPGVKLTPSFPSLQEKLHEEIILKDVTVAENSSKNVNHSFTVLTPFQQEVVLAASSRKEMEEWVGVFKQAASKSKQAVSFPFCSLPSPHYSPLSSSSTPPLPLSPPHFYSTIISSPPHSLSSPPHSLSPPLPLLPFPYRTCDLTLGDVGDPAASARSAQLVCVHPLSPHVLQRLPRGPTWGGMAWPLLRGLQVQEPPTLRVQSRPSLQVDYSEQLAGGRRAAGAGREWVW